MDPTERNRRAWDEIHRRRTEAMAGELGIPEQIRERLPEIAGKHVLHLQCATGESTVELAELGALVTAVDISAEALDVARERAPNVVFMHADVHELPLELHRHRFDLVYTGGGVLRWLHDLDAWAAGIAAALKPGGMLLLYDDHPVAGCVDHLAHWREDYFDEEVQVSVGWRHFELTGETAVEEKHERRWRLGQVVTALADAGLVVRRLEEFRNLYDWVHHDKRVPGQFLLLAERPD
jgi:SAM-dependent methyltransferase